MDKVIFICILAVIYQTVLTVGYERPWIFRQKRMANDDCHSLMPGPEKKLPLCCQMPNIILPGLNNAREKCFEKFKQIKDKPETEEYKEMVHRKDPRLLQCIFIQTGLATSDGKLNEEMITKKMSEGMNNEPKWKSLWEPALNKCFDEVKDENIKIMPMVNTPAGRLMKCVLRDLFMNCPKDIWVENPECSKIKDMVKKCPEMLPPVFKARPKLI